MRPWIRFSMGFGRVSRFVIISLLDFFFHIFQRTLEGQNFIFSV